MDIKTIFAIISAIIGTVSFFPYLKDVIARKTKPHAYTWLIWVITQGTAIGGIWYGGGGIGALGLTVGTILVFIVFLSSLRFGTKNITTLDTIILCAALLAIAVWWLLDSPLVAVLMVSAIDGVGYIPSFRKSFVDPWSETVVTWFGFVTSNLFAMLALREYNLLTLTYLVVITTANLALPILCLIRRNNLKQNLNQVSDDMLE